MAATDRDHAPLGLGNVEEEVVRGVLRAVMRNEEEIHRRQSTIIQFVCDKVLGCAFDVAREQKSPSVSLQRKDN
jgi:hypothetical protein